MDTWRSWELVLPMLERHHDVLAVTYPGHAGGPPIDRDVDEALVPDAIERAMDAAGFEAAHLVGNSLGGFVALQLAARGRALSVCALAPAGGWAPGDPSIAELFRRQRDLHELAQRAAPFVDSFVATDEGRRRATELIVTHYEHIPPDLIAHQLVGIARADAQRLLDFAEDARWELDFERIECPVRIIWGGADKLLRWPDAALRYREGLPGADWVELPGIGHYPQLDVPLETAELILGLTRS